VSELLCIYKTDVPRHNSVSPVCVEEPKF